MSGLFLRPMLPPPASFLTPVLNHMPAGVFFFMFLQELEQLASAKSQALATQDGELPDGGKDYTDDQAIWQRF